MPSVTSLHHAAAISLLNCSIHIYIMSECDIAGRCSKRFRQIAAVTKLGYDLQRCVIAKAPRGKRDFSQVVSLRPRQHCIVVLDFKSMRTCLAPETDLPGASISYDKDTMTHFDTLTPLTTLISIDGKNNHSRVCTHSSYQSHQAYQSCHLISASPSSN